MSMALARRIAAMQPGELRFRIGCEARKVITRVQSTVAAPRWTRASLYRALRRQDRPSAAWGVAVGALREGHFAEAHAGLATHFAGRTSNYPVAARSLQRVTATIRHRFPDAPRQAVARADKILDGEYTLLGYPAVKVGSDPDWHSDPVHHRRSAPKFWTTVRYLDRSLGDHKIIWELNRHQHWLAFGRAHALSGDSRYYDAFRHQIASWLAANPPLMGTNWTSMLELGFRSLSWMAALEFFSAAASASDEQPWIVDLLLGMDRQLTHVEQNLSHYFSPNTHLSGEALALYVGGLALPELQASARRTAVGREVLVREATRQVRADGGHAELSTHYHRYSTDFYLLALAVARRADDAALPLFQEAARRQARYLRTIVDDDGRRPAIGDDDGGQLWPMCGRDPADCRDTLATAAILLDEPGLAIGELPEETYWMCGQDASRESPPATACWSSAALSASGYYVSRTRRGDHLIFDAGPQGFLNGGHAHADALALTLSVGGRPLLIDPGTATYTMDPEMRDRFRGSRMHNTVILDGRLQAEPNGPFHWRSTVTAHAPIWGASRDCDYMEGTHDAYVPRRHTRAILAMHGIGWWILDHVLGEGIAEVESYWHFHPAWDCRRVGGQALHLTAEGTALAMVSTFPLGLLEGGTDPLAMHSPGYGIVEPAPVAYGKTSVSLPATFATFIAATPEIAAQLAIVTAAVEAPPAPGWHASAFGLRWSRGTAALLAAVERAGVASRNTAAPPGPWGTAALRTDARLALVVDHAGGPSEAVLVNGANIDAPSTHTIVSQPTRVPLARIAVAKLASSVHEVGAAGSRSQ